MSATELRDRLSPRSRSARADRPANELADGHRQLDDRVQLDDRAGLTIRLAIVGCGPRGLQCLEALSRALDAEPARKLAITVFEPAKYPGAGHIYDPRQPHTLRMNFATQYIDFWKASPDQSTQHSGTLRGWLERHHRQWAMSDQFVPRAVVGEYLHDCFRDVWAAIGERAQVTMVREKVDSVVRSRRRWRLRFAGEQSDFDHLVLATGHEGLRRSSTIDPVPGSTFVYPVERNLGENNVPPGAEVLIRGMGLTAIDAALVLTEGRGGVFEPTTSIPEYVAARRQPRRITMRSRSGRPGLAKPTAMVEPVDEQFWMGYRQRLFALHSAPGQLDFENDLFRCLCDATATLLRREGSSRIDASDVAESYAAWAESIMDNSAAYRAMENSHAVATGQRPRDILSALGQVWRSLYPELVQLVSYGGLDKEQWSHFARTAREMERIAFGPPAESVGKLLALMRSGTLRLESLPGATKHYDVTIDAIIAGPHQPDRDGPLAKLISDGLVEVDPTTQGVKVDAVDHGCGDQTLVVFGRATEGWVLGLDTLSRTMHPQIERWAAQFATALRATSLDR